PGLCVVGLGEFRARPEARRAGDHVDGTLGLTVVVDRRDGPGRELDVAKPQRPCADELVRDGRLPAHRAAGRVGQSIRWPDDPEPAHLGTSTGASGGAASEVTAGLGRVSTVRWNTSRRA